MLELLLKLEMSLWIEETRNNKEYLNRILHPKFKEFGQSGKVYNKKDIIESKEVTLNVNFPFQNVDIKDLNNNYLITYQIERIIDNKITTSNRSSIWTCNNESCQLIFHQGTKQN